LQYAIERVAEAAFQLEDSELQSELLPDADSCGRVLFVEAAEGGAGVLRRLVNEPSALALAAAEALRIMHVDPVSGAEEVDACVRGCYRCLLSYGNQNEHERIDRRLVIPLLLALVKSTVVPVALASQEESPTAGLGALEIGVMAPESSSPVLHELMAVLASAGLAAPTTLGAEIEGVAVDICFPDRRAAVVIDDELVSRDTMALVMAGWNVVRISPGDDLTQVVAANPSVFGSPL
jgi:hypothetical protein